VRRTVDRPTLITDAGQSPGDQLRHRQRRYVAMMSVRIGCLIVGAVLVTVEAPLLWLWLSICGVGMILVPWLAVLLANDGPPKDRHRRNDQWHRAGGQGPSAVGAVPTPTPPATVIDVEP
jgi:hypothetical protein